METLVAAHDKLQRHGGLRRTIEDVNAVIQSLQNARAAIGEEQHDVSDVLTQCRKTTAQAFDKVNHSVKDAHNALASYSKVLDKKLKNVHLPLASNDPFSDRPDLTRRAVAMHFLREGHFDIARTFLQETGSTQLDDARNEQISSDGDTVMLSESVTSLRNDTNASLPEYPETSMQKLEASFSDMYRILLALRDQGDLQPAIDWARANRDNLFLRGSDLEFELCRLRFVELYTGRRNPTSNSDHVMADDEDAGRRQRAFEYARTTFNDLSVRYLRETSVLMTSLIYASSLETSPYSSLFFDEHAWLKISNSFVREFCGLLGLSEKSPLYTAVTAGGIALPVLEKLERKMGNIGGQWTSANELPVEIPVPPTLQFHSIFVCPVSKEQATDSNPPMMMPCYHVIAKESLEQISRGSKRFKCPYCPNESNPLEAKIVFL